MQASRNTGGQALNIKGEEWQLRKRKEEMKTQEKERREKKGKGRQ